MNGGKHPFATLLMCASIVGIIAGAAAAFPSGFYSVVHGAAHAVGLDHSAGSVDAQNPHAHSGKAGTGAGQTTGHTTADCQAIVTAVLASPPTQGDVHGIEHAIAVVEANCEKNPQAQGLLNALQHLEANATKHAGPTSHAGGNGKGHGGGNGDSHAGGNGKGHAGGNGKGHAHQG